MEENCNGRSAILLYDIKVLTRTVTFQFVSLSADVHLDSLKRNNCYFFTSHKETQKSELVSFLFNITMHSLRNVIINRKVIYDRLAYINTSLVLANFTAPDLGNEIIKHEHRRNNSVLSLIRHETCTLRKSIRVDIFLMRQLDECNVKLPFTVCNNCL